MTAQRMTVVTGRPVIDTRALTHLQQIEAESIHIMWEVVTEIENPVML
jgi:hypothetical protein